MHGLSEHPELDSDEHDDSYESSDYEFLAVIAVEPSIHRLDFHRLPGPVFDPVRRETAGRVTRP